MRIVFCTTIFLTFILTVNSQDKYSPFSDLHIHPTFKLHNRARTAADLELIFNSTKYDPKTNTILFNPLVRQHFSDTNWIDYNERAQARRSDLVNGRTSDLRNYHQATHSELKFTPGSVLCASFYPFEKQYAVNGVKRFINSKFVSKMGLKRLKHYSLDCHYPLKDFMAEYYFTLMQTPTKKVSVSFPSERTNLSSYQSETYWYQQVLIKNSFELQDILNNNKRFFETGLTDSLHPITTALIMTIEGAQVLYGPISGSKQHITSPLVSNSAVRKEIIDNVRYIKNLPHRLFFIGPAHFTENHVAGFAKTIDRDPENFQHRLPAALAVIPYVRNFMVRKTYDGLNEVDSLGATVIKEFLNPYNTIHTKPTYIDVKHLDVKARIQYYYMRRELEKDLGVQIPIIASHSAVSGESQAMAAATGLYPNFDMYRESENPKKFYNRQILREFTSKRKRRKFNDREKYWKQLMACPTSGPSFNEMELSMYVPLNFNKELLPKEPFDPFNGYKHEDHPGTGWFYPWSLNLFDEEIIEICKSDGIIGLLLDPRQLGAFAPNHKLNRKEIKQKLADQIRNLNETELRELALEGTKVNEIEYLQAEPLLHNILYIVQLILRQQYAEEGKATYPWYVKDEVKASKNPWCMIALGTDYDGLIDPIDFAPTAAYLPAMHKKMVVFAYLFAQIHSKLYSDPKNGLPLIQSLHKSDQLMKSIFYDNASFFIQKYF